MAAHRRLLVPARRHADRRVLPDRRRAGGRLDPAPGGGALPRPGLMTAPVRDRIRDRALALGFDAVGFARAELGEEARARLAGFLAEGWHGDMGWMAEKADRRGDPKALWPEAVSIVALGLSYAPAEDPQHLLEQRDRGVLSVYARNRDYHDVVKGRLKQLAGWMHGKFGAEV